MYSIYCYHILGIIFENIKKEQKLNSNVLCNSKYEIKIKLVFKIVNILNN